MCRIQRLPESYSSLIRLRHLNLSRCNSLRRLPPSLGSLQTLYLSHSRLISLPEDFNRLSSLQQLSLSDSSRLEKLPSSFGSLDKLQYLDLSQCDLLQSLTSTFGSLQSLCLLNMAGCCLQSLPNNFGDLTNLKTLILSGCNHLKCLPTTFSRLCSLQRLDLSNCKLSMLPVNYGNLRSLQQLDLGNCHQSLTKELSIASRQAHSGAVTGARRWPARCYLPPLWASPTQLQLSDWPAATCSVPISTAYITNDSIPFHRSQQSTCDAQGFLGLHKALVTFRTSPVALEVAQATDDSKL